MGDTALTGPYTIEDWLAWPEPREGRIELLEGWAVLSAAPLFRHQRIATTLTATLYSYVEGQSGILVANPGVRFDTRNGLHPDLAVWSVHPGSDPGGRYAGRPPDLCVEILSPSNKARDLVEKRDVYERTGVREYWVVDPAADTVTRYTRRSAGPFAAPETLTAADTLETPLLPGLAVDLTDVLGE